MTPFDSGLVTKISPLIEGQMPDYIRSDHPQFVEFLKQYYEFLEAAELQCDGIINNIIQETISVNYILDENDGKVVAEEGVGTTGKFIEGETITGSISKATATVLIDDLGNVIPRLFISSNQRFELGETITGTTSGATSTIKSYRGNPIQNIQQMMDYANTDNTTALVLDEMQRQFMDTIPLTLADGLSKRDLIKNIKDLYAAKGTSEGHKLFLRLMFAEDADVFYPTKYMLRTSDGKWNKKSIIRCANGTGSSGTEVIGLTLTGRTSGATVFVVNATGFSQGAFSISEFEIDLITLNGTFIDGETVFAIGVTTDVEQRFTIQKIVTGAVIESGGILYNEGDIVTLDNTVGNGLATAIVNTVSVGNLDDVIVFASGANYRIGDPLIFTGNEASVTAVAVVSYLGGAFLSESSDISDGSADYVVMEPTTVRSFPDIDLCTEAGDFVTLDGTDSSATDAGFRVSGELATPRLLKLDDIEGDRIVFEEGTFSTYGEIGGARITFGGSGYSSLPTITVGSAYGSGAALISTTKNIGAILDVKVQDAGFNYKIAPAASVPANFILTGITGTFSESNILSSHTGTVTNFNTNTKVLSTTIEDAIYTKLEQEDSIVNQDIQLEENTELVFSRILANNVIENNSIQNLESRDIDQRDTTGVAVQESPRFGFVDQVVTDADDSKYTQISLEYNDSYTCSTTTMELEEMRVDEDSPPWITSFEFYEARPHYPKNGTRVLLEGTVIGDSFLIEDGGTDGSGTNAGDEILLDRTESGGADAGDKIIQFSDDEGDNILYEEHDLVSDITQRKDKFQLDGSSVQLYTTGGWVDEDRVSNEGLIQTSSQQVWVDPVRPEDPSDEHIYLEDETVRDEGGGIGAGGSQLLLDGTSANNVSTADTTADEGVFNWGRTLDNGSLVLYEDVEKGYYKNVVHDTVRSLDATDGILLEDGASDRAITSLFAITLDSTASGGVDAGDNIAMEDSVGGGRLLGQDSNEQVNVKEHLILEGIDGNSAGADVNGFYDIFENKTINHSGSSRSRLVSEAGEGFIDEESPEPEQNTLSSVVSNSIGADDPIILDSHIISGVDETIRIVFNDTDAAGRGVDTGDAVILDGLSLTDRTGNSFKQESGLAAGVSDTDLGGKIVTENESFIAGDIILDQTDFDGTDAGGNLINESVDFFPGQSISTITGAVATISTSSVAKLSATIGFVGTDVGLYSTTDSLISEDVIRIQDSYYYQDFSYEVRVGQSVANYMNELKRAVHPAGFAAFGKVSFATLLSAAMPTAAGEGRVDAPATTFSSELASVLKGVFDLKINSRLGIPIVYEEGNVFQELRLESGGDAEFLVTLEGTEFGTALETDSSGNSLGAIASEDSEDDGDNILVTGSDDGSQLDAGDQIILEGTDADGTNNVDVTGEFAYILLDGTSISQETGEIFDGGSYCVLSGTALGVYNLVDADSDTLVLNGTDGSGTPYKIVHEDGNHIGSHIVTDAIDDDGRILNRQDNIISENALGGNIIMDQENATVGKLMSEAAAGIGDIDRDKLLIRQLKIKLSPPKPRILTNYGLTKLSLDAFTDASSVSSIQLEDGLRKRGPTINSDQLLLDGVDVGEKDDVRDILFGGEPIQLESSSNLMIGTSVGFKDYYKFTDFIIALESGFHIYSESNDGGVLLSEEIIVGLPMNDFLRPDIMVMEGFYNRHSEFGRFVLDGTASDQSTGALDDGSFIVLDGIDAMQSSAGSNLTFEEQNDRYKSFDDSNDVGILLEQSIAPGGFKMEQSYKYFIMLDASDEFGTEDGTVIGLEDGTGALMAELFDSFGNDILLEVGSTSNLYSKLVLDSQVVEIESGINDGEIPNANWGENSIFPTYAQASEVSTRPVGRLALQDERAITELVLDGTDGSSTDAGDNIIFDRTDTDNNDLGDKVMVESNAEVILDQTAGGLMIDETNGENISFEIGTHSSLMGSASAFLPIGFDAESFDNVSRTKFDNTTQTYDVLEGF